MHLSSEVALDLIEGRLQTDEAGFWTSHISTCAACAQDLNNWRKVGTSLKRSHLESAPDQDLEKALHIFLPASAASSKLRSVVASIIFDSFQQPALAGARGAVPARQLVLRVEEFDIHVKIWGDHSERQLLGQVLPRGGTEFLSAARFHLLRKGERLESTMVDELGEFHFTHVPEGDLSLQVDLPNLTVIGALNAKGLGQL